MLHAPELTVVGDDSIEFPVTGVRIPDTSTVYSVAVEPRSETQALLATSTVKVIDLSNGSCHVAFNGHRAIVNDVVYLPHGMAASCSLDRSVQVFCTANGRREHLFLGHAAKVFSIAASRDGERLLSVSGDGSMRMWALASGTEAGVFGGSAAHASGGADKSGAPPTFEAANAPELYDVEFLDYTRTDSGASAIGPDASGSFVGNNGGTHAITAGQDATVSLWNLHRSREPPVLRVNRGVQGEVRCVKALPLSSGNEFLSAGEDTVLRLWDARAGNRPVHELHGHRDAVYGLTSDGRRAATCSVRGRLIVWDIRMQRAESQFRGNSPFRCVSMAPSRRTLHASDFNGNLYSIWTASHLPCRLDKAPDGRSGGESGSGGVDAASTINGVEVDPAVAAARATSPANVAVSAEEIDTSAPPCIVHGRHGEHRGTAMEPISPSSRRGKQRKTRSRAGGKGDKSRANAVGNGAGARGAGNEGAGNAGCCRIS